jgi:hypothetical protein
VNVYSWHKADMLNALTIVRFWEQKRTVTNRCLPISIMSTRPKSESLENVGLGGCESRI